MKMQPLAADDMSLQKLTSKEGREILLRIQAAMSESVYVKVSPHLIRPLKGQPRENFVTERIQSLAESMSEAGQIMPGIIRPVPVDESGTVYELLDGERRLRAALHARLPIYRAMQVEIDDKAAPYVVSVISNFNREAHTTLEVVDSIIKLHEVLGLTQIEIAKILGFSREAVNRFYNMRHLVPQVRDMLDPNLMPRKKTLPVNAACQISFLPPISQLEVAQKVMQGEVKLFNLRNEVVKIAKQHGVPLREVTVEPATLRKRLIARVDLLTSTTKGLERLTELPGMEQACVGFSADHLLGLERKLVTMDQALMKLHEKLVEVRNRKSMTFKPK